MSKNSQLCGRRFRHSDFVIPSDFVIRHLDLRIAVCSIKRPVSGLVRAAGDGSDSGKRVSHGASTLQPQFRLYLVKLFEREFKVFA